MKKTFFLVFLLCIAFTAGAQRKQIDSLKRVLVKAADDTNKVKTLFQLAEHYDYFKPDSGIYLAQRTYALAVTFKFLPYQRRSLVLLANMYVAVGNYIKAMKIYYDALQLAQNNHDDYAIIQTHNNMGSTYVQMADYPKALRYLHFAQQELAAYIAKHKPVPHKFYGINIYILNNIDEAYLFSNRLDSAAYYIKKGVQYQERDHMYILKNVFISDLGILESKRGNLATALKYFHEAEKGQLQDDDQTNLEQLYFSIANVYKNANNPDSAIVYAQKALSDSRKGNFLPDAAIASKLLYELYDGQKNIPLAYKYYKIATQINDSLTNKDNIRELASLDFEAKQKQQDLLAQKAAYENTVRSYILTGGLVILALLVLIFWRNGRQRKKSNNLLTQQKEEIEQQKKSADAALSELKQAQTQLIQSEKMASLGELTAGIAHEIQNPLNFVNNFSEVNMEMIDEMELELKKGDTNEALAIAADIRENEKKIHHHGKRADFIVKGMLQHSRTNTGERQLTNINVLADEFLKLSYHGLRAKDKAFNAELVTHFADNLPKIDIVQQDIGRVLLNLFNNAFYAVNEKKKTAGADYKPEVMVTTTVENAGVIISVRDNGNGIPDAIKDKIMQPFFTTKPTGEGTGLGLSLSYDIVVKGHGGTIDVMSKEGEYTEFMVNLPKS